MNNNNNNASNAIQALNAYNNQQTSNTNINNQFDNDVFKKEHNTNEQIQIFAYVPVEDAELLKKYAISQGLKRPDLMKQVITYFVKKQMNK